MSNIRTSTDDLEDKIFEMAVVNVEDSKTGEEMYALRPAELIAFVRRREIEARVSQTNRIRRHIITVWGRTIDAGWFREEVNLLKSRLAGGKTTNEKKTT